MEGLSPFFGWLVEASIDLVEWSIGVGERVIASIQDVRNLETSCPVRAIRESEREGVRIVGDNDTDDDDDALAFFKDRRAARWSENLFPFLFYLVL